MLVFPDPAGNDRQRRCRQTTASPALDRAPLVGIERFEALNEGAKVSYEEKENRGKTSVENLRVG